jgi:site-specific DNA-methyltransferase (adenine-specific)/adenine-specific DNA-methyltransferase
MPLSSQVRERVGFGAPDLPHNRLILGDAEAAASLLVTGSVDLIYADPPFFTGRRQRHQGNGTSFEDVWQDGVDGYLSWLRPLLGEFRRLLALTGTLYVHLDWHAVHYAKVELDRVFGGDHFVNEVIWHYGLGAARSRSHFLRKHDTLLVYRRGTLPTFNVLRGAVTPAMAAKYRHRDERGHYMHSRGRRYYLKGGKPLDSVWDIPTLAATSRERLGYPTQKPEALLERVVAASSNPGDLVLDLFCGSGTAPAVAQRFGRRWIAADCSTTAVEVTRSRLRRLGSTLFAPVPDFTVEEITPDS